MSMMTAYCNSRKSSLLPNNDGLRNGGSVSKLVYVVTMYRYGDREKHSYVLGVFSVAELAKKWGEDDEIFRGGKYKHEITKFFIDNPSVEPDDLE